jgi:hypothetical protein
LVMILLIVCIWNSYLAWIWGTDMERGYGEPICIVLYMCTTYG